MDLLLPNSSKQFVTVRKKDNFEPLSSATPAFSSFHPPPLSLFFSFPSSNELNRMNLIPSPSPPPLKTLLHSTSRYQGCSDVCRRNTNAGGGGGRNRGRGINEGKKNRGGGRAKNTITPLPWEEITTCLLLDFDEFIRSGDSRTINAQLLTHCFAATVGASPLGFRIPRRAISRRYCSCELFSPCWRFTLATSPDGLSPLSFSVGGILAGTKNSSLFFLFLGGQVFLTLSM